MPAKPHLDRHHRRHLQESIEELYVRVKWQIFKRLDWNEQASQVQQDERQNQKYDEGKDSLEAKNQHFLQHRLLERHFQHWKVKHAQLGLEMAGPLRAREISWPKQLESRKADNVHERDLHVLPRQKHERSLLLPAVDRQAYLCKGWEHSS